LFSFDLSIDSLYLRYGFKMLLLKTLPQKKHL
jgi:hypothetical protein